MVTALAVATVQSGAVTAGILIPTVTANFASDLQSANNTLRDQGGGNIILQAGGVYTLASPVTIDCGSGVGLIGNGAIIDARTLVAPLLSLDSSANLLADGGFETTTLVDLWYLYRDNNALVTTGSATARTAGTNVTSIATSASAHNSGSRSLAITRDANGSLAANTVVVACLLSNPNRADQICGMFSCMLSGGSGSLGVTVNAVKIDPFTDQWTTNFSALAASQIIPSIVKSTQLGSYSVGTLTTSWQTRAFTTSSNANAPRLVLPKWSTHILLLFDVSQINNPNGQLFIDDLYVNAF